MNNFKERDFFHEGMREFQDLFDGRRTAEAIEKKRKSKKIQSYLNEIIFTKNEVINSLTQNYKYSYTKKFVKRFKVFTIL